MLPITPAELKMNAQQAITIIFTLYACAHTLHTLGAPTDPSDMVVGSSQWAKHVRSLKIGY